MHPRFRRSFALFAIAFIATPAQALAAQATGGGHRQLVSNHQEAAFRPASPSPQRFAELFSAALSLADFATRAEEELGRIESAQPGVSRADEEFCLQKTGYSTFKRNWLPLYDYAIADDSDPKHYANSQDLRCRPFYLGYNQAIDKEVARMFSRGSDPAREWSYGEWVVHRRVSYLRGKALADNYWPRLTALAETVHKGFAEISRSSDFSVLERHVAIALQRVIEAKATYGRFTFIEYPQGGYFTLDDKYYPTRFNKEYVGSYQETVVYLAFLVEDWMNRTGGNLSYDARDFSLALEVRDLSARVEHATRVAYAALGAARAANERIEAHESAEMVRSAVFWASAGALGILTRVNLGASLKSGVALKPMPR
ncbi:MAG TPA: hypothetical protein VM598_13365 [Bdellovibrionota bacterium]|nr:hypothetical protein [Bdellovibrionota bacterium]